MQKTVRKYPETINDSMEIHFDGRDADKKWFTIIVQVSQHEGLTHAEVESIEVMSGILPQKVRLSYLSENLLGQVLESACESWNLFFIETNADESLRQKLSAVFVNEEHPEFGAVNDWEERGLHDLYVRATQLRA